MLRTFINPDLYHLRKNVSNCFEGWYLKIVDSSEKYVLAFIPGIFYGSEANICHSFIQVLNGRDKTYDYLRFPINFFTASKKYFNLYVEENNFSSRGLTVNLTTDNTHIKGNISFLNLKKWPDSIINPGSMGYYNYIPKMQCYSQVCVMDMDLSGGLVVNNNFLDFTGGKGYIEKNWGNAFPYSWIWIQANNFNIKNTALSCSIGHIPFFITSFRGFLIGLITNNTFYKFTTINKSSLSIEKYKNGVIITAENRKALLKIQTETKTKDFLRCYGPRDKNMVPLVEESLNAKVLIKLIDKNTKRIILEDTSSCGGVEYGGTQMQILDKT